MVDVKLSRVELQTVADGLIVKLGARGVPICTGALAVAVHPPFVVTVTDIV